MEKGGKGEDSRGSAVNSRFSLGEKTFVRGETIRTVHGKQTSFEQKVAKKTKKEGKKPLINAEER